MWKGGPARVIRSSPQFGFTLVAYEYLQKVSHCALFSVFTEAYLMKSLVRTSECFNHMLPPRHQSYWSHSIHTENRPSRRTWKLLLPRNDQRIFRVFVPEILSKSCWMYMETFPRHLLHLLDTSVLPTSAFLQTISLSIHGRICGY